MAIDTNYLKAFYEETAGRFWNPLTGLAGRDLIIYPLLRGLSGNLLEYGAGSGSLLLHLAQQERFSKVYGVDISKSALMNINNAWVEIVSEDKEKLLLIEPSADCLPTIESGSIDVIVCVATIEHVINPYIVLDELFRVASSGATLICSVPNYAYIKHRLKILFGDLPKTGTDEPVQNWRKVGWDGMHLHTFTKSAFSTLLTDCGWTPKEWTGWGDRMKLLSFLRARFPSLLSGEIIAICKKAHK